MSVLLLFFEFGFGDVENYLLEDGFNLLTEDGRVYLLE